MPCRTIPILMKSEKLENCLPKQKRKKAQLRESLSETEIIAALGDISGLWEFMFPGARQELVHLLIGEIRVFADKISLTLKVDGLKDLASEMAVSGYFYEPYGEPEKFRKPHKKFWMRVQSG